MDVTPEQLWEQIGLLGQDPICVFDHNFRLIAFNQPHNDEFFRVNGFYTKIGDVFPDLFIEKQRAVMRSLMARALSGEPFTVVEEFGKPELGAPQWEISYNALRDKDGNIVAAFHRARDLSDSPIRLKSFVRASDVSRLIEDAAFRRIVGQLDSKLRDVVDPEEISSISAEAVAVALGASSAGFGTMHADGIIMNIDRDWTAPGAVSVVGTHLLTDFGDYVDVLRRGDDFVIPDVRLEPRTRHRSAAFEAIRVRAAVNVPILEGGKYVAMFFVLDPQPREWTPPELTFIRNVAERARLHIERRRAERQLRLLADGLERQVEQRTHERDRLWDTSVDLIVLASYDGTLLRVSPSWTTTLGRTEQELRGMALADLVHPADAPGFMATIERCKTDGTALRHSCRVLHRDGSWRMLDWSIVPEANKHRYNAVGRDVTAEREAERVKAVLEGQLRQAQKMEAVGQLTGGLAHDFNNLLASVSGNLQLLRVRITQGKFDDLLRRVDAGLEAVRRAATLTQRLMAFSRQQALDAKTTDLNQLVAGMQELIRSSIGPDIDLLIRPGARLWATKVDSSQLESALLNLCINARDAMAPSGGHLIISTANRSLDRDTATQHDLVPGEFVLLSVTDTGCGMAPEIIPRVFDPFFTTKPLGQGTGLGLSMVYGFLGQSGGQVHIDSEVGKGTTLCLYLPRFLGDAEIPSAAHSQLGGAAKSGETILVVEDEEAIRNLLVEVLGDAGYNVIAKADGASAAQVISSDVGLDLLLSDVGLPGGMNGRQLGDAARVARPALQVLFLTGYAENAAAWSSQLEPGMHVMSKPFDINELIARVRKTIGP